MAQAEKIVREKHLLSKAVSNIWKGQPSEQRPDIAERLVLVALMATCPDDGTAEFALAHLGERQNLMPFDELAELTSLSPLQLAEAFARLHGRGILHFNPYGNGVTLKESYDPSDPWSARYGHVCKNCYPGDAEAFAQSKLTENVPDGSFEK